MVTDASCSRRTLLLLKKQLKLNLGVLPDSIQNHCVGRVSIPPESYPEGGNFLKEQDGQE
jgi:hypothetical protein